MANCSDTSLEFERNMWNSDGNVQTYSKSSGLSPELKKIQVMLSHVICNRVLAIISFYFTFFSFTSIRSIFAFGFEKK